MPTTTIEYITITKLKGDRDLLPIRLAQVAAIDYLEGRSTEAQVKTAIENITALAGIAYSVFGKTNAIGVALGIISFMAFSPSSSAKTGMIQGLKAGNMAVQRFEGELVGKSQYTATFDVELAFLESHDWAI